MAWSLFVCEGRPYDTMVRAAELALALQHHMPVQVYFEKEDAYSPWRHLLTAAQQLALRALAVEDAGSKRAIEDLVESASRLKKDSNADAAAYRDAAAKMRDGYQQPIWVRGGDSIPSRPPSSTWLLLLSDLATASAAALARYERVYAFAPFGCGLPEVTALSLAVDTETFLATPSVPTATGKVLLIGDGDVAHDCQVLQWLQHAGATQITLFDPYHCAADYAALLHDPLPGAVTYVEQGPAAARAKAYAGAAVALVARPAVHTDNHFLWEAAAMGVAPLANYLPAALPETTPWSAALCQEAFAAYRQGSAARSPPTLVDWHTVAAQMVAGTAPRAAPSPAAAAAYQLPPHQVTQFRSFEQASRDATAAGPNTKPMALLSPGDGAVYTPELKAFLQRYTVIYCDIFENAEFVVPLVLNRRPQQEFNVGELLGALQQYLVGPDALHVDIIHLHDTNERIFAVQNTLEGLHERWRSGGRQATRVPRLVIHVNKRLEGDSISRRQIGVSVAADAIAAGIEFDAQGRYKVQWLGRQHPSSERGRIYLYPYQGSIGFDSDEVDYATLPRLLANNEIDLLCSIDPFLVGGVAARALWARKHVPVVGMLHSIHSAAGATEVVMQLLTSATQPFDAIISPSHCGALAYTKLFDAASEWLSHRMPNPPRYEGRTEVIPYGVDPVYYQGLNTASCRGALDIRHDALIILSLGRFSKQEKADLLPLLLAIKELRQRHPQLLLIMAGGNLKEGYPEKLRAMAHQLDVGDIVRVRENVNAYDKILLYGAADIFVSISDNVQETYGLSILEAMAAAKPVVAAGWDGYREIVRHDTTGFLVPTYTLPPPDYLEHVQRIAEGIGGYGHRDLHESVVVEPQALVHYLDVLLGNRELRLSMGAQGRRLCHAEYNQLKQARKTGDFLLELIAMADGTPFAPQRSLLPFADPVQTRFAHYPSAGLLHDSQLVTLAPWGRDERVSRIITDSFDVGSNTEQELTRTILQEAGKQPSITLEALIARLTSATYAADVLRPRIARCIKYGLLSRVTAAP